MLTLGSRKDYSSVRRSLIKKIGIPKKQKKNEAPPKKNRKKSVLFSFRKSKTAGTIQYQLLISHVHVPQVAPSEFLKRLLEGLFQVTHSLVYGLPFHWLPFFFWLEFRVSFYPFHPSYLLWCALGTWTP